MQWVAPVTTDRFERDFRSWRDVGFGLDWSDAERMTRNNMYVFAIEPSDLLDGAAVAWDSLDFRAPIASRRAGNVSWQLAVNATIFGFALWWECTLAPGVVLSTSPYAPRTHWDQIYLPVLEPRSPRGRRRRDVARSRAKRAAAKAGSKSAGPCATFARGLRVTEQTLSIGEGFLGLVLSLPPEHTGPAAQTPRRGMWYSSSTVIATCCKS